MKKLLSVLLAIGVVITNFSGCYSLRRNETTSNEETDPVTETSIVYVYLDSNGETVDMNRDTIPSDDTYRDASDESISTTSSDEEIINNAIAAAEELLAQRDFDTATNVITEANALVSDNTRLVAEQSRIESLRPVSLLDLNLMGGDPSVMGYEEISTGEYVEAIGFTIDDINQGETLSTSTGLCYATYGNYDTFTCRLALPNDLSKNSPLDHFIKVYADGMLVYTSPTISAGSMPLEIMVEGLGNAEQIEIVFSCTNNTSSDWLASMWFTETAYSVTWCIVNPMFYPEYTPLDAN